MATDYIIILITSWDKRLLVGAPQHYRVLSTSSMGTRYITKTGVHFQVSMMGVHAPKDNKTLNTSSTATHCIILHHRIKKQILGGHFQALLIGTVYVIMQFLLQKGCTNARHYIIH